jgi:hypothetical protein
VIANGLGEMVGLGLSGTLTVALVFSNDQRLGVAPGALLTIVLCALIEGSAVGLLQHRAMQPALPNLRRNDWWLWTTLGAALAWTLGMLPSTLIGMSQEVTPGVQPAEPSQAVTLLLAAAMGLVAGPILGVGQWYALRRQVAHAWRWIPAQSAAWALGMPLIFLMVDRIAPGAFTIADALLAAVMLFLTGAVVGAVHGLVLVRLVRHPLPIASVQTHDA